MEQKSVWSEKVKFILSILFWICLILSIVIYRLYERAEKNSSIEYYTVCTMIDKYSSSKGYGKTISYYVKGKKLISQCTIEECKKAKIGSRFVIKYWDKHPEWFQIYFDRPVPPDVNPPSEGWKELPKF